MPKVIDPLQKRREILAVAATVFSQHGYGGTNLQRVASAAGMGKSSLYHYFPTRDALFEALLQDLLGREAAMFDEVLAAEGTPSQRFDALIDGITDLIDEWVKAGPLLLDCLRDERGRRALRDTLRRVRKALAQLIADGQASGDFRRGDPVALATVVIGCLDGVLLLRLLEPTSHRTSLAVELRHLLRAGLEKRGSR
jgi:AcrR family transcriptional regulator